MTKAFRAACLVLLLLPAAPARAAYLTGGDLLSLCRGATAEDALACLHYVTGVVDYHLMMQSLGTTPTIDFCLPPATPPPEKLAVVVRRYLEHAPQHTAFVAAPAVIMALNAAYPCTAPPPKKSRVKKKKHG